MAGLRSCAWDRQFLVLTPINRKTHGIRCFSTAPNGNNKQTQTPELLKLAVSGVTEILRLFVPVGEGRRGLVDDEWEDAVSVSNVDDVLSVIRSDYDKAYFVTGFFTSAIYAEECIFEDPTIKFQGKEQKCSMKDVIRFDVMSNTNIEEVLNCIFPLLGKELYARNLSLLLPFFESPSIQLKELYKDPDCERTFLVASWILRTYLRLPWKPLICIDGTTTYDLDEEFRIVRHVEGWNVSALEAILQIFSPTSGNPEN